MQETQPPMAAQIQTLVELHARLQIIRQLPLKLLKAPSSGMALDAQPMSAEFQLLRDISDTVRSDTVQACLRAAGESEKIDKTNLNANGRRDTRKRR